MNYLSQITRLLCLVALVALAAGCSGDTSTPLAIPSDGDGAGKETQGVEMLPQHIIDAVLAEFPNATLISATKEKEDGKTVYEVNVEVDGQALEVELDKNGKIIEVEEDDGDEDDD